MSFFTKVALAYCCVNIWTLWWFWRGLRGASLTRWGVCLLLLCLIVAFPLWYKRPGADFTDIAIVRAGALWLGIFPYFFLMTLATDAALLAGRFLGKGWTLTPRVCLAVLGLAVCIGVAGWVNAALPTVREYAVNVRV